MNYSILTTLLLSAAFAGCGSTVTAVAALESRSNSTVTGTATFVQQGKTVTATIHAANFDPAGGPHAVHIHDKGDCSANDATSAGPHWDPLGTMHHGAWDSGAVHLGDIGNIVVQPDGTGNLVLTTDKWTLGDGSPTDLLNHSVIIHEKLDDFTTQPTGNAGARQACGVIAKKSS